MKIIVKAKSEFIFEERRRKNFSSKNKNYIFLFKNNENVLISFLIENFRDDSIPKNEFKIFITKQELEELIKIYEVNNNFINKLIKAKILSEKNKIEEKLCISFRDCFYTIKNEENTRKLILHEFLLKKNKEFSEKVEKNKSYFEKAEKKLNV